MMTLRKSILWLLILPHRIHIFITRLRVVKSLQNFLMKQEKVDLKVEQKVKHAIQVQQQQRKLDQRVQRENKTKNFEEKTNPNQKKQIHIQ